MLRIAKRLLKSIPHIALLTLAIALTGCTTAIAPDLGEVAPDFVAEPPDREAETRVMAHIDAPPSFEAPPADSFEIFFANVHKCHGRDFVTVRVVNDGTTDFIWASEWLIFDWTGDGEVDAMSQYNVAKPFMPDAGSCPRAEGYNDLLEPGDTAYIGVYLGFDFDDAELGFFGDRGWDDITWLLFYVELSTDSYPYSSSTRPRTLELNFILKDMPARSDRSPTPAAGPPPTARPAAVPTATPMPGIGG